MGDATGVPALPGGTVTFLLTDVEGSTRLWEANPKQMERALAGHDQIVAEAVATHGGVLIKNKGEGDSAFAVFTRASDAAGAALACQLALAAEAWPDDVEPRVRIAIHTGEAELRDGDYYGPVINRAARLRGTAHGGQIVLSHTTADLVRDHLPAGAALNDLGAHRLPDLGRPETIFGLTHSELPSRFPPLRSLDAFPGSLPVQLTSFVGRERELTLVADALSSARVVTLTGTGGVGKTRLALHAAADVLAGYPDGAWLCELAAADTGSMMPVVAVSLGLAPKSGALMADDIAEFLGGRRALIVLDNCEHLLDSAADLVEVLVARCPWVRLLATSREALDVAGEQVIRLRSLAVPAAEADFDELARTDATRLFVERAAALGSQPFEASDAPAIVEICRRLDGIPLAIELAAARAVALSPSEISNLLNERFRLLTGGRRASVERHHTLRAAIDWSYSLLRDNERQVFDRLGVFPATFDAAAAQAVAADDIETWDVIDALSSLVAKSMLVADRTSAGATRFQMLETMRQYARERLDTAGKADACRRLHAQHYAGIVRRSRRHPGNDDDVARWSQLRIEVDNLRAGVLWALDASDDDSELALNITADLCTETFEEWSGVFAWADRAVERAQNANPGVRSVVLAVAAMSAWYRTDYGRAHELASDALRDVNPARSPAPELPYMALLLSSRPDQIRGILADGLAALDAIDADSLSHARLHSAAAGYAAQIGDLEFATAEAHETLRIGRQGHHRFFIMTGLYLVALTTAGSTPDDALAALEECITLSRYESLSANWRGRALALAAQLRARNGDAEGGISALQESVTESHRTGERAAVATAFDRGIQVLASTGNHGLAAVFGGIVTKGVFVNTFGIPDHELPDRRTALDRLEAELGAQPYATAIARGAAMTYDEALDCAARQLGALITP